VVTLALMVAAVARTAAAQPPAPGREPDEQAEAAQAAAPAAPDPLDGLTLNLTFEGYYQYSWNQPAGRLMVLRAYDTRANTFGIQQTALVVELAPDRQAERAFGLRLDLQFGQATETVQGSPANEPRPDVYRNVWQVFGSYVFPGLRPVRLDFGKFASSLGFETNYAKDNHHFSRAYLFNVLPFYHSGLRAAFPLTDHVTVLYMLTNGIQQTEDFNNFKSSHLAAVVTPVKGVSWTVNYYFGREQPDGGEPDGPDGWFRVFDTYVTYAPHDRLSLGADVNHVTSEVRQGDPAGVLDGFGGYVRYQATAEDAIALRYEWIDDEAGLFGGVSQALQEITLTYERKVADGFLVRGEVRRDWSDTAFFPGRASADPLNTGQTTALVGLVWWVGGKKGVW
jgi:hypothetical protein